MKRASEGSLLSTVFVDYDNIYLSLKRKSEEAAKRFAKDAGLWIAEIASGRLITPTNGPALDMPRRIVMNRCYGNPVPRRNAHDNSTDMNSFPFVRHHYLRAGFEVIDCPPLTAQLKNSADIRMVMDVRDYLLHDTYFDEFIILSGDADFTPVLHRLRQHARRTVIYSNDYTAAPYTAISDGEVREADLIAALLEGRVPEAVGEETSGRKGLPPPAVLADARKAIIGDVLGHVRNEPQPLLLEVLADRAVRKLGHEHTVGTAWGGAGSFRDLLTSDLPDGVEVTEQAPHYVYDVKRQSRPQEPAQAAPENEPAKARLDRVAGDFGDIRPEPLIPAARNEPAAAEPAQPAPRALQAAPAPAAPVQAAPVQAAPVQTAPAAQPAAPQSFEAPQAPLARRPADHDFGVAPERSAAPAPMRQEAPAGYAPQSAAPQSRGPSAPAHGFEPAPPRGESEAPVARPAPRETTAPQATQASAAVQSSDQASAIQKSIARIHEACQAPPISPPEYRALFEVMAEEINTNGLTGTQTLVNICERAKALGVEIRKDDARFILEVVSEADPWFEQGASAPLFAGRFRNFVIARCKSQGLQLSATELDLIEAWFTGSTPRVAARKTEEAPAASQAPANTGHDPATAYGSHPVGQAQPQAGAGDWFSDQAAQPARAPAMAAGQPAGDQPPDFGRYTEAEDDFPRVLRNRRA